MKKKEIGTDELMEITGYTSRHLHRLAVDGILPKPARNRWPMLATLRGLWTYATTKRSGKADLLAEQLRKVKVQSEMLEDERDKLRGELVAAEDVRRCWGGLAVRVRQVVIGSGMSEAEKDAVLRAIRETDAQQMAEFGGDA